MALPQYDKLDFREIKAYFDGAVLVITIDQAKSRNTFIGTLGEELVRAFELGDRDDRVRVIILTAEPNAPAYCSGAELSGGWSGLFTEEEQKEGPDLAHRDSGGKLALAIYRCRKITIAAVNGHAVPTSTYLLPRLLGQSRASSLLITGSTYSPSSPQIQSLYHEIVPSREEVFPKALALAKELAANTSQMSVAYTKALMQHPGDSAEENHLLDSRAMKILASSKDASEGVKAFFERRQPQFPDTLSKDTNAWYPWWRTVDVKHRQTKL